VARSELPGSKTILAPPRCCERIHGLTIRHRNNLQKGFMRTNLESPAHHSASPIVREYGFLQGYMHRENVDSSRKQAQHLTVGGAGSDFGGMHSLRQLIFGYRFIQDQDGRSYPLSGNHRLDCHLRRWELPQNADATMQLCEAGSRNRTRHDQADGTFRETGRAARAWHRCSRVHGLLSKKA